MSAATEVDREAIATRLDATAAAFLACLTNSEDGWEQDVTFQLFSDGSKPDPDPLALKFHRSLTEHWERLDALNRQGAGIFISVNGTDFQGRKRKNIVSIRGHHSDLDAKDIVGPIDWAAIIAGLPLEPTIIVRTPGGLHLYWLFHEPEPCDGPARQKAHEAELAKIVEVLKPYGADPKAAQVQTVLRVPGFDHRKAEPRMVVLEKVGGPRYTRAQIREAFGVTSPEVFPEVEAEDPRPVPTKTTEEQAEARGRALEWLKMAPRSIKGQKGDATAIKVANRVLDIVDSEDVALDLMLSEAWDFGCGWTAEKLAVKVRNARKYRDEPVGHDLGAKGAFSEVPQDDDAPKVLNPLERMNSEYAFILIGSKGHIMWEHTNEKGEPELEFLAPQSFHDLFVNVPYPAPTKRDPDRMQGISRVWMAWPKRRTYDKLCFAPNKVLPPNFCNLWRGFAFEPKPGDWSHMRAHIREVICSGNEELDAYVMGWCATAIQFPGERAEVALSLRGPEGAGKGTLGHWMRKIFGRHGVHASQAKHVTGAFNNHLREAAFLFADEALFAGDRATVGALKALITEPTMLIEGKGKDAVTRDNCLHVLMATNEDWVVQASAEARRFCVIDVARTRLDDFAYFEELKAEENSGGLQAMLHDLLAYDLSKFQIRKIPQTKALIEQKVMSQTGADRWLRVKLQEGGISTHQGFQDWTEEGLVADKQKLYEDHQETAKSTREYKALDKDRFWERVKALMAGSGFKDYRPHGQARKVKFPPLDVCRDAYCRNIGYKIPWDTLPVEEPPEMTPAKTPKQNIFE